MRTNTDKTVSRVLTTLFVLTILSGVTFIVLRPSHLCKYWSFQAWLGKHVGLENIEGISVGTNMAYRLEEYDIGTFRVVAYVVAAAAVVGWGVSLAMQMLLGRLTEPRKRREVSSGVETGV